MIFFGDTLGGCLYLTILLSTSCCKISYIFNALSTGKCDAQKTTDLALFIALVGVNMAFIGNSKKNVEKKW